MYQSFKWTRASLGRNAMTRAYEPLQPHLLMALAEKFRCETFLDIGANVGAYALLMTRVPTIRAVHAFEPSPETFAELQANVRLNGDAVVAHNKAVSDEPGALVFGIVNTLSGANSVIDTSLHSRFERKIEVAAVKIDDFLPLHGQRLCLKMDIEGHEPKAIVGMRRLLTDNEVLLQIEDYGADDADLTPLLTSLGLQSFFRIGGDRYFTNVKPLVSEGEVLEAIQAASEAMVRANLEALYADEALDLSLGNSFTVRLRGGLASKARSAHHLLSSRFR